MKKLVLAIGFALVIVAVASSVASAQVAADDIVNITWQWAQLTETEPAAQSVVPNPRNYTIVFQPDGSVNIKADCNLVGGTYTLSGDALTIALGPSTMAFCGEDSLDQLYLTHLANVGTAKLEGGRLVLGLRNNAGQMFFDHGGRTGVAAQGAGTSMGAILDVLARLAVLVFVVSSMLAMGLSLTVQQIIEPLKNARLVILALVANFVLVPALAFLITFVIPLDEPLKIGLILLATAGGAPFLPKLAQVARGNMAFSVGLMVLLMVVTVVYVPLVLPLLLPGVQVNPLDIAGSLVVLMLIPLAVGLFVKARYEEAAASLQPIMAQASNYSLMLLMVLMLVLNFSTIIGTIGTGAIIAALVLVVVSLVLGYFLGGPGGDTRRVMGLGTAQRNVSAALVVAGQNFTDPNVIVMVLVGALLMLVVLMVVGGELGRRSGAAAEA